MVSDAFTAAGRHTCQPLDTARSAETKLEPSAPKQRQVAIPVPADMRAVKLQQAEEWFLDHSLGGLGI